MRKIVLLLILMVATVAHAADITLTWEKIAGAVGYRIYISDDFGATWSILTDAGDTNTITIKSIADDKFLLFRIGAYAKYGETVRYFSGAWYNGAWKPLDIVKNLGIR